MPPGETDRCEGPLSSDAGGSLRGEGAKMLLLEVVRPALRGEPALTGLLLLMALTAGAGDGEYRVAWVFCTFEDREGRSRVEWDVLNFFGDTSSSSFCIVDRPEAIEGIVA